MNLWNNSFCKFFNPVNSGSDYFLFDTLRTFEPTCSDEAEPTGPGIKANDTTSYGSWNLRSVMADGQKYMLFPNPNDGNFKLQQVIADDEPVAVEIWDVVGRSLYKDRLQFTGGAAKLRMENVVPGVYMLQLTDSNKRKFRFKFVVD